MPMHVQTLMLGDANTLRMPCFAAQSLHWDSGAPKLPTAADLYSCNSNEADASTERLPPACYG
jgi:hypothetical protein